MKVLLRHNDQMAFMAKADSNHWVPVDAGPVSGGSNGANSPVELLLIAAGGCVSMDMIHIFTKGRQEFTRFEMEIEATRAETHPRRILSLHFHAMMEGSNLNPEFVIKALNLSLTKYCSVTLSLDRSVALRASFTVNGIPGEAWEIARDSAIYR